MSNNALAISYFEMPNPVMEWLIINVKFYLYEYFFVSLHPFAGAVRRLMRRT